MLSIRSRRARLCRPGGYDRIAIRHAGPEDEQQIRALAALDGRETPDGPKLIAEADGHLVAAIGLAGGELVADPFQWTGGIVGLLEMRAAQLAQYRGSSAYQSPSTRNSFQSARFAPSSSSAVSMSGT
jgi:hypothetical protein